MSHYQVSQLKHLGERSLVDDLQVLRSQFNPNATGTALIGIFTGLFGLASDECLLLTKQPALTPELIPQGFKIVQAHHLSATVRPTPTQSFDQAGIYVFRFWTLPGNQVDALIALSVPPGKPSRVILTQRSKPYFGNQRRPFKRPRY